MQNQTNPMAVIGTINPDNQQTVGRFQKSAEERKLLKRMKNSSLPLANKTIKHFRVI